MTLKKMRFKKRHAVSTGICPKKISPFWSLFEVIQTLLKSHFLEVYQEVEVKIRR